MKQSKEDKQIELQKRADEIMVNVERRVSELSHEDAKNELRIIIGTIVGFFAMENPKVFQKGQTETEVILGVIKTVIRSGTSAITFTGGFKSEKFEKFMDMLPLIRKYADDDDEQE